MRSLPAAIRSPVHYPFFVPRNSNGCLPVYSDIRNGRTRFLLTIRNVNGDASALARELSANLFPPGSPEASRLKISVHRSSHLIIQGGRWKRNIMDWLVQKGF
ncbi:hypothetical protein GYMLUDRAFT_40701 [Collybiopsis luxurians FD-317 M1]|uniref:Large ribosomal subunit protein mL49 n=1 Tax=Collybiopsis luxurians FD-317 M1 TaxID=944289 RepID=A0A0D0D319_9AGAR|nr:hypothetical protein GYMLUDRAFT_40701 [Collybiopsis luxurians FD-317 M1]